MSAAIGAQSINGTLPTHEQGTANVNITNASLQLSRSATTLYNGGNGSPPTPTAVDVHTGGNSGWLNCAGYDTILIMIQLASLTGGTSPTVQFYLDIEDAFGNAFTITTNWAALANTTTQIVDALGAGLHLPYDGGTAVRIRWSVTGGPTAATADITVLAK